MLGFIKALAARARLFAEEAGQNLVETALIIAVVSVAVVTTLVATNLDTWVGNVADAAVCQMQGKAADLTQDPPCT